MRKPTAKCRGIKKWLTLDYTLLIVLLIVIVVIANAFFMAGALWKSTLDYSRHLVSETSASVDIVLDKIQMLAGIVNNNAEVQTLFADIANEKGGEARSAVIRRRQELLSSISRIVSLERNVMNVVLMTSDGQYLYSTNNDVISAEIEYLQSQQRFLKPAYASYQWSSMFKSRLCNVVAFQRHLVDNTTITDHGSLFLVVRQSCFSALLRTPEIGEQASLFLVDENGGVIAGNQDGETPGTLDEAYGEIIRRADSGYRIVRRGQHFELLLYAGIERAPWKMVAFVNLQELLGDIVTNLLAVLCIGALGILLCATLSFRMSRKLTKPIRKLMDSMALVESGEKNVDFSENTFQETKALGEGINHMLMTLSRLADEVMEGELRQQKFEFEMLRAQINPHFVYNTLETVNLALLVEGKEELSEMITDLSDILRYSLNKNGDYALLREDFENMRKYLHIMSVRGGNRHRVVIDVGEGTENCRILKMLVQPFVENALRHGMEGSEKRCTLEISSAIRGNRLMIRVRDDGVGMSEALIRHVTNLEADGEESSGHLGMRNTFKRLKLYYREGCRFDVESRPGGGTTVTLLLPVEYGGAKHENIDR